MWCSDRLTVTIAVEFTSYICDRFCLGSQIDVIIIDIANFFDTVNYDMILDIFDQFKLG